MLMFQDNCGLKAVSARAAVTAQTAPSTWHCNGEWQLRLSPMRADRILHAARTMVTHVVRDGAILDQRPIDRWHSMT